jgi:hypothetical protein
VALASAALLLAACAPGAPDESADSTEDVPQASEADIERIRRVGLETDLSDHSIDLSLLLSGGPSKDGIPALTQPALESVEEADDDQLEDTRGIFVEFEGERRFYPFSILVWHEIVNDRIGDTYYAATF